MATISRGSRGTAVEVLEEAAAATDKDGAAPVDISLPAGYGECFILAVMVRLGPLATATALGVNGALFTVVDKVSGAQVDFVGTGQFYISEGLVSPQARAVVCDPTAPVLWREEEYLRIYSTEQDTNAAPTADWFVQIRVQPLRAPAPRPREFRLTS